MREATGDLWAHPAEWKVITTNGSVRKDGAAVMGRGVALQAKTRFPHLPAALGALIRVGGNHTCCLGEFSLLTLPVKHEWHQKADLVLIQRSAEELALYTKAGEMKGPIAMPRPGCGNGGLDWKDVKPIIEGLLDDRFVVVQWPSEEPHGD